MYIKRLIMHGFKSFPKKTEILYTPGINVILGPNGSGKSNISDALCFVLGRLSIKSMRAAKAKNLIFLGSKSIGPAKEASVEVIFDNSDKTFSVDTKELSIKRTVRRNGQSIYKINSHTKTRQEVLSLLAQAGVDPNGFNIILQGEIQNFVRMHSEERRKIIEEVSGISIYESRKAKSLKELEKTDNRLNDIMAILRERTAFLNNLEKERQQALRYKKLEANLKRYKASIIFSDLNKNKRHSQEILDRISKKNKEIERVRKSLVTIQTVIQNYETKITSINTTIQRSTGLEQERLNKEIADIRADLAGLGVRSENHRSKLTSIFNQKTEFENSIRNLGLELKELQKESPNKNIQKQKELTTKKQELEVLEEQRKKFYMVKSELKSIKDRMQDKKSVFKGYTSESELLLSQIKSLTKELFDREGSEDKLEKLKFSLAEKNDILNNSYGKEKVLEKISNTSEYEIDKQKKLMEKISKMDVCPLCKSKITENHIHEIYEEINPSLNSLNTKIQESDKRLTELLNSREVLKQEIEQTSSEIYKRESDSTKLNAIDDKKSQVKNLQEKINKIKAEAEALDKIQKNLERSFDENSNIEQKYETLRVVIQEVSSRTRENVGSEISFKQKEFERSKISLKQLLREEKDLEEELSDIDLEIEEQEGTLDKKMEQEERLSKKFEKMYSDIEDFRKKIRESESELSAKSNTIHNIEQGINELKIDKARFDAMVENLETDMLAFPNIQIIRAKKEILSEKLAKTEEILSNIGNVNLRSLEMYGEIKKEYDAVKERVEIIEKEKHGIMKIIHEIDIKKKKSFLKTLEQLNIIFSRNFSQLSVKGHVFLELENRKNPFEAGVGIVVKTGHGKYFDVTSLSGGEQTLVALSLIFAIQELSPYAFYILDEIDAALDKRNSERLANLLTKYMQRGQYIVITHNDEIITNATNLYGVSMHEGVSKIISLKI